MLNILWNKYGFWAIMALIIGVMAIAGFWGDIFPPKPPAGASLNLIKIITYERAIKANVINLTSQADGDGIGKDLVWVLWDEKWIDNDPICPFVEKNKGIGVIIVSPLPAIVEADGAQHLGHYYRAIWAIKFAEDECISAPINVIIVDPDAVNWDWQRH